MAAPSKARPLLTVRAIHARNKLVLQWKFLPLYVYKRICQLPDVRNLPPDDVTQAGFVALMRAAELYDPSRKVKFVTYATRSLRTAMLFACRQDRTIHVPDYLFETHGRGMEKKRLKKHVEEAKRASTSVGVPPELLTKVGRTHDDDDETLFLLSLIGRLPRRHRTVIRQRFYEDGTQKSIGKLLGICTDGVRRIEKDAIIRLRDMLADSHFDGSVR